MKQKKKNITIIQDIHKLKDQIFSKETTKEIFLKIINGRLGGDENEIYPEDVISKILLSIKDKKDISYMEKIIYSQKKQYYGIMEPSKLLEDINNNLEDTKNIITHGKLKLDPSQLECEWDGKQLPDKLTTTEFLIVKELAKRPGIIKERSQLMDIAYREDTEIEDRTIDSHVKRIRKKFKKIDTNFSAIETRYGSGYRWNVS